MKKIYTWLAQPAERCLTIADLKAAKGVEQFIQVNAKDEAEAAAAESAGIDMVITDSQNIEPVRRGAKTRFVTAAIALPMFATIDDIHREAFRALADGADAVMTARSPAVVESLAREDIPVMGHLGLVPRKSTWTGGLRAVGKTAEEAHQLFMRFRRLENAGAVLVEAELIAERVMREITSRTTMSTVSLGSGRHGDVTYLFSTDIFGENPEPPRHARAFADLATLHGQIERERVQAYESFRDAVQTGSFPTPSETVDIDDQEFETFLEKLATS